MVEIWSVTRSLHIEVPKNHGEYSLCFRQQEERHYDSLVKSFFFAHGFEAAWKQDGR